MVLKESDTHDPPLAAKSQAPVTPHLPRPAGSFQVVSRGPDWFHGVNHMCLSGVMVGTSWSRLYLVCHVPLNLTSLHFPSFSSHRKS